MLNARTIRSAAIIGLVACVTAAPAAASPDRSSPERNAERAMRIPAVAEALERCEAGDWRAILWRDDAAAAIADAERRGLPLLVFFYKTLETEAEDAGPLVCLGARITRGAAFADPAIQEIISTSFVPLQIDIAAGIPDELASLNFVQRIHDRRGPEKGPGFSMSVALSSDGEAVLATSLSGQRSQRQAAERGARAGEFLSSPREAHVARYAAMLETAADAHKRRGGAAAEGPAALRQFDRAHRQELWDDFRRVAERRRR
jgi:hypothetical protein